MRTVQVKGLNTPYHSIDSMFCVTVSDELLSYSKGPVGNANFLIQMCGLQKKKKSLLLDQFLHSGWIMMNVKNKSMTV